MDRVVKWGYRFTLIMKTTDPARLDKLVFIASDYKPRVGGRADYIDNLARGLVSIGVNASVLAIVQPHHRAFLEFLKHYEVWVRPFQVIHDKRPASWILGKAVSFLEIVRCLYPSSRRLLENTPFFRMSAASVAQLEAVLVSEKPTAVVFGHLDLRLYPLALHLIERRVPYVIIVHGREIPCLPRNKNDFIRRRIFLKGARWVVANSHDTWSLLQVWGIHPDRLKIVNPPIAEAALSVEKRERESYCTFTLVTLCRLVRGKAVDVVLRAMKIVVDTGMNIEYVIGGDGDERQALEELVDELGLRSRVKFLGYVTGERKWSALRDSDVFVMTSRAEPNWVESFGIAFVEASAAGLPVVGSKSGGIADAVVDGETGILVPEDSPEELAKALAFLYRHPEVRAKMGRSGRKRATQFAPTVIARRFISEISDEAPNDHSDLKTLGSTADVEAWSDYAV